MRIWLLEPFYGGSHRAWCDGLMRSSVHQWRLFQRPARHWKWRMQGAAISLAEDVIAADGRPDLLVASDMLDCATFLGLARRRLGDVPLALYFHENQLSYPWSPTDPDRGSGRDLHYGFINYTSALASDRVFFNSRFHRRSFLDSLPGFLNQFPDARELQRIKELEKKSEVLPLGMNLRALNLRDKPGKYPEATLLWNHRWEYDKAPEVFFTALFRLKEEGIPFRLIVLGRSYRQSPEIFEMARHRLQQEIVHFGYAESQAEYARLLWQADILPVASRQDFFGGSVVEAIYCNCFPLLPNRLAYPEHIPEEEHPRHLYEKEEDFYLNLKEAIHHIGEIRRKSSFQHFVARYDWSILATEYDRAFEQLAGQNSE